MTSFYRCFDKAFFCYESTLTGRPHFLFSVKKTNFSKPSHLSRDNILLTITQSAVKRWVISSPINTILEYSVEKAENSIFISQ